MGAVTPGETLGTLYNIHVGSNKTKQHTIRWRKGKDGHPEDRLKDIFLYQKRET